MVIYMQKNLNSIKKIITVKKYNNIRVIYKLKLIIKVYVMKMNLKQQL